MSWFKKINSAALISKDESSKTHGRLAIRPTFRLSRRRSPSPSEGNLIAVGQPRSEPVLNVEEAAVFPTPLTASIPASAPDAPAPTPQIVVHDATDPVPPVSHQPPELASAASRDIEDVVIGNDLWNRAFRAACTRRSLEERRLLSHTTDITNLFKDLQERDAKDQETSSFQKGAGMVAPLLNGLNFVLSLADPISNFQMTVSSAIAIAKMVTALGIMICGAAQELHSQIEMLLKDLPRIDFCDAIQTEQTAADIVQDALIIVYGDLLDFFFHGIQLLQIRELLHPDSTKQIGLHNTLKLRAENACEWLIYHDSFQDWMRITPGSKYIALTGEMGCGKTMTVAHVVDFLRSTRTQGPQRLVCSYFCKDDGEMNEARNVYRGLLSQLLAAKVSLGEQFHDWYKNQTGSTQVDPTQDIDKLRDLLTQLVNSVRQALYIIIDALDECNKDSRAHLFDFFKNIHHDSDADLISPGGQPQEYAGLVRVLISSRHMDSSRTPEGVTHIKMQHSPKRDLEIVQYLSSERYLQELTIPVRAMIVTKVAQQMQGSAIWATMVLQYMQETCSSTTKEARIQRTLQDIPPPQGLSQLYAKLFEHAVGSSWENRWRLANSLDLMAAARRQLTLRELSYAVSVQSQPSGTLPPQTLKELEDSEDWGLILRLVRPFVVMDEAAEKLSLGEVNVRLIHQSLKQLILSCRPSEWSIVFAAKEHVSNHSRDAELNSLALSSCMDYLLLHEFGELKLVQDRSQQKYQDVLFGDMYRINLDDDDFKEQDAIREIIDPKSEGFGGFYTYAACFWTIHYQDVAQEYMPDLEKLIALSQPGSTRMRNWLDRMRQPDWRVDLERNSGTGYNPLALVAWFGNETALKDLLDRGLRAVGLEGSELRTSAIQTAVKHAIEYEKYYVVEALLIHPTTCSTLQTTEIFFLMATKGRHLTSRGPAAWCQLLDVMFSMLEDVLIDYANYILVSASRAGCLPMVERLFDTARTHAQIRTSLLRKTDDDWGPIGWAGNFGHTEVVRYLCEQEGIESHLYHRDPHGDNIYNRIAGSQNVDALRIIIKRFPEGVHQTNHGTSPLQVAVNFGQSLEVVKLLLLEGQADVNAGDPYYMPLKCAVRKAKADMCRMLIVDGSASPWAVVSVSDTRLPYLTERIQAPAASALTDEQAILRDICSLLPLAVSMDVLSPASGL